MQTKLYKEFRPYGTLTVLPSGKRYFLCSPHPLESDDWAEKAGQQMWSVYSRYDGFNHEEMQRFAEYSSELKQYLYDGPLTIVEHPTNIHIELSDNLKGILVFDDYQEEPEEETEVDLTEDDGYYLEPDYLLDLPPVEYEKPVVYLDDGFPV